MVFALQIFQFTRGWCVCECVCWAQLCLTLWDPMNCTLPGSSVHGISQARILEWVAISYSRESFWPRDGTHVSCVSCITWVRRKQHTLIEHIFMQLLTDFSIAKLCCCHPEQGLEKWQVVLDCQENDRHPLHSFQWCMEE